MSRSGYSDDCDDMWAMIRWGGQVASSIRGKRGQALLRELVDALDAMPEKKLIAHELEKDGSYCALGVVGMKRGLDIKNIDPEDYDAVAEAFNISQQLAREVVYQNDDCGWNKPEERWKKMRDWAVSKLKETPA